MTGDLEASSITWGDTRLPYAIRRSARRKKTVAVMVDPSGDVLLVAPEQFSTSRLDAVVRRKAAWIVQRLRHLQSHDPPPPPREFVSGESVLYLGRHYRLKVHPNATGEVKLRGGWLHVPALAGAQQTAHVRAALVSWFRRHAAKRLPERVVTWRARAGVEMPRVVIADQQKRWGAATATGPSVSTGASSRRRCAWSTTSSSTSSCTCATAVTAAITGRRSGKSCRTTSGAVRICGSGVPGWRGRGHGDAYRPNHLPEGGLDGH